MNRRELIGTLGLGAAALAANGTRALADHEHGGAHDEHIKTILDCMKTCNETAHHCLDKICKKEGDVEDHAKLHSLTMDCQAFCILSSTLMARSSHLSGYAHQACADACRDCARACDDHKDQSEQVKECSKACKECERTCRDMVKNMPHHH